MVYPVARCGVTLTEADHNFGYPSPHYATSAPIPDPPSRLALIARFVAIVGLCAGAGAGLCLGLLLRPAWELWVLPLTMVVGLLACTARRRCWTAFAAVLMVLEAVATAVLYPTWVTTMNAMPAVVAAVAMAVLLTSWNGQSTVDGVAAWWRHLLMIALPAGLAATLVIFGSMSVPAMGSDIALPALEVMINVAVAGLSYMLTLGKDAPRKVHTIGISIVLAAQLPVAVWTCYEHARAADLPQHGRGPAGVALVMLGLIIRFVTSRRPE